MLDSIYKLFYGGFLQPIQQQLGHQKGQNPYPSEDQILCKIPNFRIQSVRSVYTTPSKDRHTWPRLNRHLYNPVQSERTELTFKHMHNVQMLRQGPQCHLTTSTLPVMINRSSSKYKL